MAAVVMISDVHDLHSRTSVHVAAHSVGAEAVVICRVAVVGVVVVVAAAAAAAAVILLVKLAVADMTIGAVTVLLLLVKVAVVDMTTGTVTMLPTALECLTPVGKTLRVTRLLPANTPVIKLSARLPQVDPGRRPDTKLVWRIWQVRVICFSQSTSNTFFLMALAMFSGRCSSLHSYVITMP